MQRQYPILAIALLALAATLPTAHGGTTGIYLTDGAPDPSLNPPVSAPFRGGIPGLFTWGPNLGGALPYSNSDVPNAVLVQPDGKIVAAGYSWTSNGSGRTACIITRFNADGTTDLGFGMFGVGLYYWGTNDSCAFNALALQGDGRIVAVGTATTASTRYGIVTRFSANGAIESSFGTNGWAMTGIDTFFNAVTVLPEGTILAAGAGTQSGQSDKDFFWETWRGDNGQAKNWGWVPFNLSGAFNDRANAIAYERHVCMGGVLSCAVFPQFLEEHLYLVGDAGSPAWGDGLPHHWCAIARLKRADGSSDPFQLDTSFVNAGRLAFSFNGLYGEGDNYCNSALVRPEHGVVVGGETAFLAGGGQTSKYLLADVDMAGTATDRSGSGYFQWVPINGVFNAIHAMAWAPDGKLLLAGDAGTLNAAHAPSDAGVLRLLPDYTPDPDFGDGLADILSLDGYSSELKPAQFEGINAMALDNQGRIVVVGKRSYDLGTITDYNWLVGRLLVHDGLFRDSFDGVVPSWNPNP